MAGNQMKALDDIRSIIAGTLMYWAYKISPANEKQSAAQACHEHYRRILKLMERPS